MDDANHYRKRADEADAMARLAADPQLKQCWLDCAASWREMEKRAERQEREAKTPANDD